VKSGPEFDNELANVLAGKEHTKGVGGSIEPLDNSLSFLRHARGIRLGELCDRFPVRRIVASHKTRVPVRDGPILSPCQGTAGLRPA